MRGICLKCENTIKSGKLYLVYDKELKSMIPICAECRNKYYVKEDKK